MLKTPPHLNSTSNNSSSTSSEGGSVSPRTSLDNSNASLSDLTLALTDQTRSKEETQLLVQIITKMMQPHPIGVEVKDRKYHLRTYHDCFIGSEAIDWLVREMETTRTFAVEIANRLRSTGWIKHVVDKKKPFLDGFFFYKFKKLNIVSDQRVTLKAFSKIDLTNLDNVITRMRDPALGIQSRDRTYHMRTYKDCFIGSELVDWMMVSLPISQRSEAVIIGKKIREFGYLLHVADDHDFEDAFFFYRWTPKCADLKLVNEQVDNDPTSIRFDSIDISHFEVQRLLGSGSFSNVYLVKHRPSSKYFAMKAISKTVLTGSPKEAELLWRECQLLRNDHPFLLSLYYLFQTADKICLVIDYMERGTLGDFIAIQQNSRLKEKVAIFIIAEIALALECLHKSQYIYRDLKPANILIDNQGHIRLADFNLSRKLDTRGRAQSICGTPAFIAPEVIAAMANVNYGIEADFWSLGVMIYQLICGINPFVASTVKDTLENVRRLRLDFPEVFFSPNSASLISELLARQPENRMCRWEDFKRHPFFAKIDWEKLRVKGVKSPLLKLFIAK
eukprot:TRINITY_DN3171_c2_g1_i1.p1 TRINITY_DN3171_c2_g1~~TRINITY_DN3171_c2_g1_i1.p1  ORF type:complete len:568 (-),score=220.56 TRINITY_DN3171_c2_g1_i1:26-1708(-)